MTRRKIGQLARIPLGDNHFAYALVLDFAKFAIYGVDLASGGPTTRYALPKIF